MILQSVLSDGQGPPFDGQINAGTSIDNSVVFECTSMLFIVFHISHITSCEWPHKLVGTSNTCSVYRRTCICYTHTLHIRTCCTTCFYIQPVSNLEISGVAVTFDTTDSHGVDMTVWSSCGEFSAMGYIVDQLDSLIEEWFPGKGQTGNVKLMLV